MPKQVTQEEMKAFGLRQRKPEVGARSTFTERAKKEGYPAPQSAEQALLPPDFRYPSWRKSVTTELQDGRRRYALDFIYTFFGSIVFVFFTAMGKVWVAENIIADGILAKSVAHGIFAALGLYLSLSIVQHVVTTVDPSLGFLTAFMSHRTDEFGRNKRGMALFSNDSIISGVLSAIAALGGALVAGGLVFAFQFSTSTLAGTPIGLAEHDRPFWSEFFGCFFLTWAYFVAYYEPVFLFHNANPAAFLAAVYGVLILFTAPYSGGSLSWSNHFGPAIVSWSIAGTTAVDWLYYYIPPLAAQLLAALMWFWVFRATRTPENAPAKMVDEEEASE